MKMMFFNNDTSMVQRKNSESPTGIKPMASQIPVGRSNQLSYVRLVVRLAIYQVDMWHASCILLGSTMSKSSSVQFTIFIINVEFGFLLNSNLDVFVKD